MPRRSRAGYRSLRHARCHCLVRPLLGEVVSVAKACGSRYRARCHLMSLRGGANLGRLPPGALSTRSARLLHCRLHAVDARALAFQARLRASRFGCSLWIARVWRLRLATGGDDAGALSLSGVRGSSRGALARLLLDCDLGIHSSACRARRGAPRDQRAFRDADRCAGARRARRPLALDRRRSHRRGRRADADLIGVGSS